MHRAICSIAIKITTDIHTLKQILTMNKHSFDHNTRTLTSKKNLTTLSLISIERQRFGAKIIHRRKQIIIKRHWEAGDAFGPRNSFLVRKLSGLLTKSFKLVCA